MGHNGYLVFGLSSDYLCRKRNTKKKHGKRLSDDDKKRLIADINAGMGTGDLAKKYKTTPKD